MTEPEAVPIQHEYVTDETFVRRLTGAFFFLFYLRPRSIVLLAIYGLIVVGYAFVLVLGAISGLPSPSPVPLLILVFATAYFAIVPAMLYRKLKRTCPVGSRYAIGLGESAMRLESPLASSVVVYRAYQGVLVIRGFAFLRHRNSRFYSALPLELFPGGDLERLRQSIARAAS